MRTLFDKTRQRFGRTQCAPRRGENRPEAIRINPTLSASKNNQTAPSRDRLVVSCRVCFWYPTSELC